MTPSLLTALFRGTLYGKECPSLVEAFSAFGAVGS